jgi:hypothetical protein
MTIDLIHEALAKAHHFVVALALGVEIRPALASTHGQSGQAVLENLLEGQELQDSKIDTRVKTESAFIWTDGAVHLDAETAIDMDFTFVVHPRNPEHDHAFRLDDSL